MEVITELSNPQGLMAAKALRGITYLIDSL